jgi:hypothetical protein
MGKTVQYEGYKIRSSAKWITDWEKWRLRIFISFKQLGGVKTREFSSDILYATEEKADFNGITLGQRLIDGKVEGRSVMDMKKTADRRATSRRATSRLAV